MVFDEQQARHFMRLALEQASKSPPRPTNFRVGAVLVASSKNEILATGYTLELPGNTHAEQCCLQKLAEAHGFPQSDVHQALPGDLDAVIFTTMEPCIERLSGNVPCVDRILQTRIAQCGIKAVYTAAREPDTFVQANSGRAKLESAGVTYIHVPGFEQEALQIATQGHTETPDK